MQLVTLGFNARLSLDFRSNLVSSLIIISTYHIISRDMEVS